MNRERLIILRDHLNKIATQNRRRFFSLRTWFSRGVLKHANIRDAKGAYVCGTAACALGEACFIPEFKAAGLCLPNISTRGRPSKIETVWATPLFVDSAGMRHRGYGAGAAFFGLTEGQACDLFDPDNYKYHQIKNPRAVARRIDQYLSGARS